MYDENDFGFKRGMPGFVQRVRFAFGWDSKSSTGDDAPPLSERQLPATATIRRVSANYTEAVDGKFEDIVRYGWRRNELIHSCIAKKARSASQVELVVRDKRTNEIIPDHGLKKLVQAPNPEMSEYDLWSSIITYQSLAGRALFEKERTEGGEICRLWPLRPDWTKAKMRNNVQVEYYRYQPTGASDYKDLDPKDVVTFRVWDPMGLFSTWAPVAVCARVGDVDNEATDLIKSNFQEGGVPPIALKVQGRLQDPQVTEMRSRWRQRYGGWRKQIEPAVLDNGADVIKIGFTFKEMGFNELDARSEARICMVLDVPPILVGAKIGLDRATYSNYNEARLAWWQDSLMPAYADLLDVIVNQLLPEFEDHENISVEWDFSRVAALQEERTSRWTRATAALTAGGITLNEFRVEVGQLPIGPLGDVYLRSNSITVIPATEDAVRELAKLDALVASLKPAPVVPPPPAVPELPPGKSGEHDHESKESALPQDLRVDMEKELTAQLINYFTGQQTRIMEAVNASSTES